MLARLSAESRRFYVWLGAAVGLGLVVRLAYAIHYKWDQGIGGDAFYFHYQANGLGKGYGFIDPYRWIDLNQGLLPSAIHPPLYTAFLSVPSALGFQTFREHIIASIILGTGTVLVVGLAGRVIAGARVGIVAAFLAAIYANLWINDGLVMSETITAFTIALVVLFGYRYWRSPSWTNAALFGLMCGLATLTRTEVIFLFPIVALPLALRSSNLDLKPRLQRFGVMVIVAALPVVPWVTYNLIRFEHPVYLSTGGDFTLKNSNCDATYYGARLGWWDLHCDRHTLTGEESQQADHYRQLALDYINAHKSRLPVVLAARVGRIWDLYRPIQKINLDAFEQGRGPTRVTKLALGQFYILAILAIVGLVLLRRRRIIIYPLIGLAVIATLAAMLAFGNTRYRVTAEIGIVLAAAVPIAALLDRWWPSRSADGPPTTEVPHDAAAAPPTRPDESPTPASDVVGAPSGA